MPGERLRRSASIGGGASPADDAETRVAGFGDTIHNHVDASTSESHVADGRGALLTSPDFRHETLETGFGRRQLVEMAAFANVVSPWRTVLRLFDERGDKVQHAGVARKQAS